MPRSHRWKGGSGAARKGVLMKFSILPVFIIAMSVVAQR